MRVTPWVLSAALLLAGCAQGDDVSDVHQHPAPGPGEAAAIAAQGRPDLVVGGPQGRDPQFLVRCGFSHSAPDDPIVHAGRPGASHQHVFFGNRGTTATSTYDDLLGEDTTCEQRLDTASYWAPALLRDGDFIEPSGAVAYYRAGVGMDPTVVEPYPAGLMMLAGDAGATAPQPVEIVAWACGAGIERAAEPLVCPERAPLRQVITFPDCWDGQRLDAPHHREHVAYSAEGSCPASHPVPIPQLTLAITYPVWGDPTDLLLASGPTHTLHADFWNVWDQGKLTDEVGLCLHRRVVCQVTS